MKHYFRSLRDSLAPRFCVTCRTRLSLNEPYCCLSCLSQFPYTYTWLPGNEQVLHHFLVQAPVVRAASLLQYTSFTRRLLFRVKYYHTPGLGIYLGTLMADLLHPTDFFDGIDLIIPLPLNKVRAKERGYNQSECFARGISRRTGIPMDAGNVVRTRNNPTQTSLSREQRRENVRNIFFVTHPERLQGRHLLLVDDVLTTGATLSSCAVTLAQVSGVKLSILTFAMA